MNDGDGSFSGFASLLWPLALAIMGLGVHVALGYLRHAGRAGTAGARWLHTGAAALALGSALWAVVPLGVSSSVLAVRLGYSFAGLLASLAAALVVGAVVAAILARWHRPLGIVPAGLLLGSGAIGVAWLGIEALGLEPGAFWQAEPLALALPLAASGCVAGFWVAMLAGGRAGALRQRWRWAASAVVALGLVLGDALAIEAAVIEAQNGSLHEAEFPAAAAALAAAFGVALLLASGAIDLLLRRHAPANTAIAPRKRRRTRRQII